MGQSGRVQGRAVLCRASDLIFIPSLRVRVTPPCDGDGVTAMVCYDAMCVSWGGAVVVWWCRRRRRRRDHEEAQQRLLDVLRTGCARVCVCEIHREIEREKENEREREREKERASERARERERE